MKTLELSECGLESQSEGCTATGRWLLHEYLGLGDFWDIELGDMQRFVSAEWPLLKHLCIGATCGDLKANTQNVQLLACGPWSLHSLSLSVQELNVTGLTSLLRNCQPLTDDFSLDVPEVYFFDVSMFGDGPSDSFVDRPGLQSRPWSSMKTLAVAFNHGDAGFGP